MSVLGGPNELRTLVTAAKDLKVKLWDFGSLELLSIIDFDYSPTNLVFIRAS